MARCQALRPSLHNLHNQSSGNEGSGIARRGRQDVRCLETNLMLKSVLPNAGLWICPNTGHAINLEEPAAFNAQIENFLSAVERGSWRHGFPGTADCPTAWDARHVATIRSSNRSGNSPVPTWFVCTTNDGLELRSSEIPMKPRVGVYLSEGMAARLAEAAKRPGATKSALVEAALDRFLGSDDDVGDTATVARRLGWIEPSARGARSQSQNRE